MSEERPITTEDLLKFNLHSDPQFHPKGDSYAFVSTRINDKKEYESHLYVHKLGEDQPTKWTGASNRDSQPRYSPDGKSIAFQSNRSGISQIWLLATDGGEASQLTHFTYGASSPKWSKDGSKIIFQAALESDADVTKQKELSKEERKKEAEEKQKKPIIIDRLKHKSDARGFHLDDRNQQIVSYDLKEESFTQLTKGEHDHHLQDISPCGGKVLFSANLSEDSDYELVSHLYLLNLASKEVTQFTEEAGAYGNARFSPDGKSIVCFGHAYEFDGATLAKVLLFDIETKDKKNLSEDWDFQLGDLMIGDMRIGASTTGPVWDESGDKLYFIATYDGKTTLNQVSISGERTVLYDDNNHVFGFAYDQNHSQFILGISSPTEQGDFYLLDSSASEPKRLTKANPFLDEISLSEPEELTITAEDGWEIQGWLLKPYGFEEGKKYPFVLEVHGGPHAMYGQTFFHEMQLLAAKGYVVLYTNPRGSHGYGQKFVDAVRGDYGGSDYTDLMSAVDYALENFSFIDEDRLGVTGGSYGGFMTNWIVGHTNRFKAAVTQRSISNWLSFYGVSDIGYFFTKWELGYDLLEDPKKLWEFSPLKYAENVETPLLIVHGELDYRCPVEQGEQLFIALKHLRKDVKFVRFPGANHELSRSGNPDMRMERLNHIVGWFEKHL